MISLMTICTERLPLWKHQKDGIEKALELSEFVFLWDVGVGKTRAAVGVVEELWNKHGAMQTLILCPPIVIENWRREILKYSYISPNYIVPLTGTAGQRCHKIDTYGGPKIYITNYETLSMFAAFTALEAVRPKILICDELHRCKNMTAKRTKKTIELADIAEYKLGLTGSPVLNSPADLFAQFRIIDKGKTFGDNFFAFRAHYFYDKNAGVSRQFYFPDWQIKHGALEAMSKAISKRSSVVKKSECLDLPPLVRKEVFVELSPEQRKHYDELKKDFVTYLNDKACTAPLAMTKALRLQQIASGHLPLGDQGDVHVFKNNPRTEALKEILQTIPKGEKCIIWSNFTANYEELRRLCKELDLFYVELHGQISASEKDEAVDLFENDPDVVVLIGNPQAGGIGINLTAASYAVFYSRGFSLEHDIQSEGRNFRGGSERHQSITRIDIICQNSIDEVIAKALKNKENISDKILSFH